MPEVQMSEKTKEVIFYENTWAERQIVQSFDYVDAGRFEQIRDGALIGVPITVLTWALFTVYYVIKKHLTAKHKTRRFCPTEGNHG